MISLLLKKSILVGLSLFCLCSAAPAGAVQPSTPAAPVQNGTRHISSVTLSWPEIEGAVYYELRITDESGKAVWQKYDIYAAGCQVNDSQLNFSPDLLWQVRGLNMDKVPVSDYTDSRPLLSGALPFDRNKRDVDDRGFSRRDYTAYISYADSAEKPLQLTTSFGDMAYMPVYPVYSWVPVTNAAASVIDVFKGSDKISAEAVASYKVKGSSMDYYDEKAYTSPGNYFFHVKAYDSAGRKIAQSIDSHFSVTDTAAVAALGDSITHGGGAVDTPPSSTLYNWETYSSVPVLNIGYSGNLTSDMLRRFEADVLPFQPRLLIIMGGVNDIRTGITAQTAIANLAAIRDKCTAHNIVPVFLTMTSVNPPKMKKVAGLDIAPGWQNERRKLNDWIKMQDYYVDINDGLTDSRGFLPDDMTTDGLHPDYEGKKQIGEMTGDYVRLNFAYLLTD